jgi:hypothetical protein
VAIDRSTPPEVLRRYRARYGETQTDLAVHLRLALPTIQRYEKRGAPRSIAYALLGIAILDHQADPEEAVQVLWAGSPPAWFQRASPSS